jgi:hypothetical protein
MLPRGEKLVLADFLSSFYFTHFLLLDLCSYWITKKHCLWLVGHKDISAATIVIF